MLAVVSSMMLACILGSQQVSAKESIIEPRAAMEYCSYCGEYTPHSSRTTRTYLYEERRDCVHNSGYKKDVNDVYEVKTTYTCNYCGSSTSSSYHDVVFVRHTN